MAEKKRGRPPKNITLEQRETIGEFYKYIKSDIGSLNISKKITTSMQELTNLATMLSSNGLYNPIWSEQLEQKIGFNSESSTTEQLASWLQSPDIYSINLRRLSSYLENAVAQYGRAVSLLSDIKSYNYDLRCATQSLSDSIDSKEFDKSYKKALQTLRKLNIPYQIRKLDSKVCKEGVAFVWFSKTADTIDLLQLPTDFCYITSSWSYGYLFAIDLTYFDRFAFSGNQVPELWKAYEFFCKKREELVNGSVSSLVPYQYYPVSPFEGWCCVFDSARPLKVPPMIGAAQGAMDSIGYRDLIKQKALVDLYRVLSFKIPLNSSTGKMQITYKEATQIIDAIKGSLPENFVAFSSPFETEAPINADQTSIMDALQNISNKSFYDYSAIPNALFNSELKSAAALKLSSYTLFSYASASLYASMQNLVNWILKTECGNQFDWHVVFHGNKLYEDEEKQNAVKLFQGSNAPVSYVYSYLGYEPFDIENAFIIENKLGIKDKMKPISIASTQSGDKGAPEKLDIDRSEASDVVEDAGL